MIADRLAPTQPGGLRRVSRRLVWLLVAVAVLVAAVALSIVIGARAIAPIDSLRFLFVDDGSADAAIVRTVRVPRTALALAVGAALGLAGALMQGITRNPLADPGLLGVNAGSAAAVVAAIAVFDIDTARGQLWFALIGAAAATVLVYLLGTGGRPGASPMRMVLAGAATTAVLGALVSGLVLVDQRTFDAYRFWSVGSFSSRPLSTLWVSAPALVGGAALALTLAPSLNALALGDETSAALGARPGRIRAVGIASITLLCGAATAVAGPISFVGLTIPHVARAMTGPDQRWILPYSMVLAPTLLVTADVVGRLLARPGEIEVGIVTAFIGAPIFILLARRRRWADS